MGVGAGREGVLTVSISRIPLRGGDMILVLVKDRSVYQKYIVLRRFRGFKMSRLRSQNVKRIMNTWAVEALFQEMFLFPGLLSFLDILLQRANCLQ